MQNMQKTGKVLTCVKKWSGFKEGAVYPILKNENSDRLYAYDDCGEIYGFSNFKKFNTGTKNSFRICNHSTDDLLDKMNTYKGMMELFGNQRYLRPLRVIEKMLRHYTQKVSS